MRKILFGIFGIMLCATNAFCDDVKVISPNSAYQDILDSDVRMDAVTNVIKKYYWSDLDKTKFASVLREAPNLSVRTVRDACIQSVSENPDEVCINIVNWVVQEHNRLVVVSSGTGGITEAKYNQMLGFGYECQEITYKRNGLIDEATCQRYCRDYAIANMCKIINYHHSSMDFGSLCQCNSTDGNDHREYNYIPSWEDYKKLIQERGQE